MLDMVVGLFEESKVLCACDPAYQRRLDDREAQQGCAILCGCAGETGVEIAGLNIFRRHGRSREGVVEVHHAGESGQRNVPIWHRGADGHWRSACRYGV